MEGRYLLRKLGKAKVRYPVQCARWGHLPTAYICTVQLTFTYSLATAEPGIWQDIYYIQTQRIQLIL
jgi:hypothetical protein